MNVIAARPMTVEQFLEWEERQDERYEFDGVRPVAMNGGTRAYNFITGNVYAHLRELLRGGPCRAYMAGMKVQLGDRVRYPDVMVACGATASGDSVETTPIIVFEVLSPSTAVRDRMERLSDYCAIASLCRHVIVEQDRVSATVLERAAMRDWRKTWAHDALIGSDATLAMPEIGVELRLGDLYEGVTFSDVDTKVDI